jgi:hypothetical protein
MAQVNRHEIQLAKLHRVQPSNPLKQLAERTTVGVIRRVLR